MNDTKHSLSYFEAFLPIAILIILLYFNVSIFGDSATAGANQFALILGASIAMLIGWKRKIPFDSILQSINTNIKDTSSAILILLMVGCLTGTWMLSGIVPSMIYYGILWLPSSIFLVSCTIICALISLSTGSSWTTSATVGIALVSIGETMGVNSAITAGAVISGAYFGDKMSPLSDTTNLASAMAGTDLFTHIRYMMITTAPSLTLSLLIFFLMGLSSDTSNEMQTSDILHTISNTFNISPWLFLVPLSVILMIVLKVKPFVALLIGALLGSLFAIIFQQDLLLRLSSSTDLKLVDLYQLNMQALTNETFIETGNALLDDQKLFRSKGLMGMLPTIGLILSAMIFGGSMHAIGALDRITDLFLSLTKNTFGLFAGTVFSCLGLNVTASDQYLAIILPGKMFSKAYKENGLAPENLSRTLEDSATVTSVLIPWNTCGAFQSSVLNVSTAAYLPYAFFNLLSPFMTLLVAATGFRIKKSLTKDTQN